MSEVQVTINERSYKIGCDEGQEEHVKALAQALDARVSELAAAMGQIGDNRLLVMAGILLADDLGEALNEPDNREQAVANGAADALAASVEALAGRIEKVAERLEQS